MIFFMVIILFIGLMGGMAFFALNKIKQTDPKLNPELNSDDLLKANNAGNTNNLTPEQYKDVFTGESAQDFLPFNSVQHDIVDLGEHRYRAFIECGSVNYSTCTEEEQNQIENTYQRFLNSLDFPIVIYVQTRTIDNEDRVKETKEEAELLKKVYPNIPTLHTYCDNYQYQMENLGDTLQNNKQKKKYIIVTYDEANQFETLNDSEKYKKAIDSIYNRCLIISERLRGMGISTNILETNQIYELIHSTFSKDCYSDVDNLTKRDIIPSVVNSNLTSMLNEIPAQAKADRALVEAQKSIYSELYSSSLSEELKSEFAEILKILDSAREKISK